MQGQTPVQNQLIQKPTLNPSVISGNREQASINTAKSEFTKAPQIQPEITPLPPEIKIPRELKDIVEKGSDAHEPRIEKDMYLAGVKLAKESTFMITVPTGVVQLPMTYMQAIGKERKSSVFESIHWLAAIIMYEWRKKDFNKKAIT